MPKRPQKSKVSNYGGLFYFTIAVVIISLGFVFHITLRNECISTQREIIELEKIQQEYSNKIKFLDSKVRNLMTQSRIEKVAREKFGMVSPAAESLIVVVWEDK